MVKGERRRGERVPDLVYNQKKRIKSLSTFMKVRVGRREKKGKRV